MIPFGAGDTRESSSNAAGRVGDERSCAPPAFGVCEDYHVPWASSLSYAPCESEKHHSDVLS